MEWLQANWLPLSIVVAACVCFIIYMIKSSKTKGLRQTALEAILKAEQEYKTEEGQEKMIFAIDYVYSFLPAYIKLIIPCNIIKKYLNNFIQKAFDEVKELLDYQKPVEGGTK